MSVDVGEHRHGRALFQPGALEGQRAVHCMRDAASGSMGESSANAAAMSTPSLASARSSVSVAMHIAKRNPPPSTKLAIVRATARFSAGTDAKPSVRAMDRLRSIISVSHAEPA